MDQHHIDGLLERYLHLLHDYTSLREELAALQTGMYQNIARANFAAERGVRFGQDYYDDRMQASRRLAISYDESRIAESQVEQTGGESRDSKNPVVSSGSTASFVTVHPAAACPRAEDSETFNGGAANRHPDPPHSEAEAEARSIEQDATDAKSPRIPIPPSPVDVNSQAQNDSNPSSTSPTATPKERGTGTATAKKSDDPLRWFGLLTPMPLRQAQAQSIRAVEHVIPRLASLDAEMALVEIEVRRARKRRAKAEAAANKSSQQSTEKL